MPPRIDPNIVALMRLAVYTDYSYHRVGGEVFAERAFALFLAALAPSFERTAVLGRLDPCSKRARYPLGNDVEFVPLPFYPSLNHPLRAALGMARSLRRIWRSLATTDCIWLLGPHPLAFPIALMALLRRQRLVLGVRQEFTEYVGNRHPGQPAYRLLAAVMEHGFRGLARFCRVIVVGPSIAASYRRAKALREIAVSLVPERDVASVNAEQRDYSGELRILSVGRLDPEKNPLLLADVLMELRREDPRWKLEVCGEGSLEDALEERLRRLNLDSHATLHGYVPLDAGLRTLYRRSHALLHVSWTEGIPQVLFEAFAAALPVVATDVGGIATALTGAVRLAPPGDAPAAANELRRLCADSDLRHATVEAGRRAVLERTLEHEVERVAQFIST